MAKTNSGHFIVVETEAGRWVAASTIAPYFCFRADSEEAVLAKVKAGVTFCRSLTVKNPQVRIAPKTLTPIRAGKRYELSDILEAA